MKFILHFPYKHLLPLDPKTLEHEGFKTLRMWVATHKNEGNVGSHGIPYTCKPISTYILIYYLQPIYHALPITYIVIQVHYQSYIMYYLQKHGKNSRAFASADSARDKLRDKDL